MIIYIVRRLVISVIVLIGVTIGVFGLLHVLPGGPARALLGIRATPEAIAAFNKQNGYNKPFIIQYIDYVRRTLDGNLGFSYHYGQSVSSLLAERLPKTLVLVIPALILSVIIAVPLGLIQAWKRNTVIDSGITVAAFVGYSMPTFWLGLVLVMIFAVKLHMFPALAPQSGSLSSVIDDPRALVLPIATLTIVTIALFSRFMRSAAIDTLVRDYIRTARAKGVSKTRLIIRHVLPNSLLGIITLIGLSIPGLVAGVVIVETVFSYPGMGLLFWDAATTKDYPILMAFTLIVAVATVAGNLLSDLLYSLADPRIRYG